MDSLRSRPVGAWLFVAAILLTCLVYWPGLQGGWFFDDYPNIVDNTDVQPPRLGLVELVDAALSSPASDLKRPLASLSFAGNYLVGGLDPFGWKLVNLAIHLLNGWLVLLLARALFNACAVFHREVAGSELSAALIAAAWLLLPVNLTAVLFVVQRMESMANLFVLLGLLGYLAGRRRMLAGRNGLGYCIASLLLPTALGVLAKETAIMLPLYAFLVEWVLFGFRRATGGLDRGIALLFGLTLALPALAGLALLAPWLLKPSVWASRDFTLGTRLLSEARIVIDYIAWTLLPLPQSLSFYHDHYPLSRGLLSPWSTLSSLVLIFALLALAILLRQRRPLIALGLLLYFGSHLLTGTVLPLELVYEHRNYFPSLALLLTVVPVLVEGGPKTRSLRYASLVLLLCWWSGLTWLTAKAWSDPLRLAADLAVRAPESPRAQFGFGKELMLRAIHAPDSPQFAQAVTTLEQASAMPGSSILPEQQLIVSTSLIKRPLDPRWWNSIATKLSARAPNSEDMGALGALARCARSRDCELPLEPMQAAFIAALAHRPDDARVLTVYSDWAWNVLGDHSLGEQLADATVRARPRDADARITLARMNLVMGRPDKAREQLRALEQLNHAGRLDAAIAELRRLIDARTP